MHSPFVYRSAAIEPNRAPLGKYEITATLDDQTIVIATVVNRTWADHLMTALQVMQDLNADRLVRREP